MLKIGLTGGIASGKTSVARWFAEREVRVFDADKTVHELYTREAVIKSIVGVFGEDYLEEGSIDRLKLGGLVFDDRKAMAKLERIIHPYVYEEMLKSIEDATRKRERIIILDLPLLFETGWTRYVDEIWTVYTSQDIQIERLMKRNNFSREEALKRISSQLSLDYKAAQSDRVIDNSGDWKETEAQLLEIWRELVRKKIVT